MKEKKTKKKENVKIEKSSGLFKAAVTVFRRELSSYLSFPGLYAAVLVYSLVLIYLYFRSAYLSGNADMQPLFDALPWALLLFVPALTMRQLTEERKSGIYDVIAANPILETSIVLGKFLSVFVLVLLANSLFLLIPAVLSPFGSFDTGKIFTEFVGISFLAMFISAVSIFASSLTLNQYTAFLLSAFFILITYLFSMDFILLALPPLLRNVFEFVSPFYQYQSLSRGVIDFGSVIYFFAGTWFFVYAASLRLRAHYATRKNDRMQYAIVWTLSVLILISSLFLASRIGARIDLTREKLYSLSASTRSVLKQLDNKLVIKVYASKELPPEIASVYRDVKSLLDEYRRASNGKIEVAYYEPDVNPKAKIEASNYGIPPIQFNVISNEEYKVKEGYLGLVILYGGKYDTIPVISSTGSFELQLTSAIYGLTNKMRKKIGIISDAGGRNQLSGATLLAGILSKQYEVEEVFVSEKQTKLDNYDALLILGPSTSYEPAVLRKLKDYISKGGSLFVAADMIRVNTAQMSGEDAGLNVNDITGPLGLTFDPDIVMDLKSHENVVVGGENQYVVPYPFWVRPQIADSPVTKTFFSRLSRLVLLWPSSIEIHKKKDSKIYPLLKTTDYAAAQTNYYMLEPTQNFEAYASRAKSYVLAAACEFKGSERKGRIVAVGDAEFLDDSVVQQNQENLAFAYSAIHWVLNEKILMGLKQKSVRPPALSFPDNTVKEGVRYFVLIFTALIIILFGAGYRYFHYRGLRENYVS